MGCRKEVQRDELESHIQGATKGHLDLACGKLRETQEKSKEQIMYLDRLERRVTVNLELNEKLEEKLTDLQHQHHCKVDSLQQQHQRRVSILQKQLEQKVKTCQQQHQQRIGILQEQLEEVKTCQQQHQQRIGILQEQLEEVKTCQQQHQRRVGILQKQFEQKVKTCEAKLEQKISMERKILLVFMVLVLVFYGFS